MSSPYDISIFYPSPSSGFYNRQLSEPLPSPVSFLAFHHKDRDFDAVFYNQHPYDTITEEYRPASISASASDTLRPQSSISSAGGSASPADPIIRTPMSPVPSERSISGVSLSAVVPGTPLSRRRSLLPAFPVPELSGIESDEWKDSDTDAETDEPHNWICADNNLYVADSVAALYAATNNLALTFDLTHKPSRLNQVPSTSRPRLPSVGRSTAGADTSTHQHYSRDDSLFERLAKEKLAHFKHPFAAVNIPVVANIPVAAKPTASSSMTSLMSTANMAACLMSHSASWPPPPSPPATRPYVVRSTTTHTLTNPQGTQTCPTHTRALTTTETSVPPTPLLSPPTFPAPADTLRHPESYPYQSTAALSPPLPVHTNVPSSPLLDPRPAPKPPQERPLTILTNVNINTNTNTYTTTSISPVSHGGWLCSHRTVIGGKPCCHMSGSDDDGRRKESTSRKALIGSNLFRRARSYTWKDAAQLHHTHELQHRVQVTHDYHYSKRLPDKANISRPMPIMPVTGRTTNANVNASTGGAEPTTPKKSKNARRSPPVGHRHITTNGPVTRTPYKPNSTPLSSASVQWSSPQHILPPSELHCHRKRHVSPSLEVPHANLHRSSFMIVADEEDDTNLGGRTDVRSRRNSTYSHSAPWSSHSRIASDDSNARSGSNGSTDSGRSNVPRPRKRSDASSISRGRSASLSAHEDTESTEMGNCKEQPCPVALTPCTQDPYSHSQARSFCCAHHPSAKGFAYDGSDDGDDDDDDDDEKLQLDSPFTPADWGYERYGFNMPCA